MAIWRKAIEVFDEDAGRARTLALIPKNRCGAVAGNTSVVQLRLSDTNGPNPNTNSGLIIEGPGENFRLYVEKVLLATLRPGDTWSWTIAKRQSRPSADPLGGSQLLLPAKILIRSEPHRGGTDRDFLRADTSS
jgi:hypothetical protein